MLTNYDNISRQELICSILNTDYERLRDKINRDLFLKLIIYFVEVYVCMCIYCVQIYVSIFCTFIGKFVPCTFMPNKYFVFLYLDNNYNPLILLDHSNIDMSIIRSLDNIQCM